MVVCLRIHESLQNEGRKGPVDRHAANICSINAAEVWERLPAREGRAPRRPSPFSWSALITTCLFLIGVGSCSSVLMSLSGLSTLSTLPALTSPGRLSRHQTWDNTQGQVASVSVHVRTNCCPHILHHFTWHGFVWNECFSQVKFVGHYSCRNTSLRIRTQLYGYM